MPRYGSMIAGRCDQGRAWRGPQTSLTTALSKPRFIVPYTMAPMPEPRATSQRLPTVISSGNTRCTSGTATAAEMVELAEVDGRLKPALLLEVDRRIGTGGRHDGHCEHRRLSAEHDGSSHCHHHGGTRHQLVVDLDCVPLEVDERDDEHEPQPKRRRNLLLPYEQCDRADTGEREPDG